MVLVIYTYNRINNIKEKHQRLVKIHQKYNENDSMECICFISGLDQPDDQPEHRLRLS